MIMLFLFLLSFPFLSYSELTQTEGVYAEEEKTILQQLQIETAKFDSLQAMRSKPGYIENLNNLKSLYRELGLWKGKENCSAGGIIDVYDCLARELNIKNFPMALSDKQNTLRKNLVTEIDKGLKALKEHLYSLYEKGLLSEHTGVEEVHGFLCKPMLPESKKINIIHKRIKEIANFHPGKKFLVSKYLAFFEEDEETIGKKVKGFCGERWRYFVSQAHLAQ